MKTWSWVFALVPIILGGCTSVLPTGADGDINTPVSQQAVVGEARRGAKAHTDLGMMYLREGQLNIAINEARTAVAADSTYALAYNLLGLVQMYLEENRAAEESFARALQIAPNDPEINNNFGWFLCQTKRERQSIEYFVAAAKSSLYTTPTKPLTNAAVCSTSMGDDKGGEEFALKALRADPQNNDARFLLTDLYFRTGRYIDARLRLAELHRTQEVTAQSAWLGFRIERKLGDRQAEAQYASSIRRNFRESREYQLLMQGAY